jgi:hypothetical protein
MLQENIDSLQREIDKELKKEEPDQYRIDAWRKSIEASQKLISESTIDESELEERIDELNDAIF